MRPKCHFQTETNFNRRVLSKKNKSQKDNFRQEDDRIKIPEGIKKKKRNYRMNKNVKEVIDE